MSRPRLKKKMAKEVQPLNQRQLDTQREAKFIRFMCRGDLSNRDAAIAAGFSEVSAHSLATRLLKKDYIVKAIQEARARMQERTEISVEKLVKELARVGFANMQTFMRVDDEGQPHVDLSDVSEDDWASIQEITTETFWDGPEGEEREVRKTKIKLHPKLDALEKIAKHLGLYGRKGKGVDDPDYDEQPVVHQHYTLKIGNAQFNISRATEANQEGGDISAPSRPALVRSPTQIEAKRR